MPAMDGIEATRRLRAMGYRRPSLPLTAATEAVDSLGARLAGLDQFLAKPSTLNALRTALGGLRR